MIKLLTNYKNRLDNELAYFSQYHSYLASGKYRVMLRKKSFFYLVGNESKLEIKRIIRQYPSPLVNKNLFQRLKHRVLHLGWHIVIFWYINKRTVQVHSRNDSFQGHLIMRLNNKDKVKIFNLETSKILNLLDDFKTVKTIDKIHDLMSDSFNTTILEVDQEAQEINEALIDYQPLQFWGEGDVHFVTLKFLTSFRHYLSNLELNTLDTVSTKELIKSQSKLGNLRLLKEEIIEQNHYRHSWVKVPFHGDLHYKNILLTEDDILMIDFEHVQVKPFVHYVMKMFVQEYVNYRRFNLLEAYFDGVYNEFIEQVFTVAETDFDDSNLAYYLLLYLASYKKTTAYNEDLVMYLRNRYNETH